MIRISPIFLAALLTGLLSCQQESGPEPQPSPQFVVDPAFQTYVDRFVDAARDRGVKVDVSNLDMRFVDGYVERDGFEYCGFANRTVATGTPDVDISRICWDQYDEVTREILIFHELGHAILDRRHINTLLPSLAKRSIMHGELTFDMYSVFTMEKRGWYLDELFNPDAEVPAWGQVKSYSKDFWADDIDSLATGWEFATAMGATAFLCQGTIVSNTVHSASHALSLGCQTSALDERSQWLYTFDKPDVPIGTKLVLKAHIKTEELNGDGIVIAFYGENDTTSQLPFFYFSTELYQIKGTRDWEEYQLPFLAYFPNGVDRMKVAFIAGRNTTGKAWIDDVKLELWE